MSSHLYPEHIEPIEPRKRREKTCVVPGCRRWTFLAVPTSRQFIFPLFLSRWPMFHPVGLHSIFFLFGIKNWSQREGKINLHVSTRTHCPSNIDNTHKRTQTPKKKKVPSIFQNASFHLPHTQTFFLVFLFGQSIPFLGCLNFLCFHVTKINSFSCFPFTKSFLPHYLLGHRKKNHHHHPVSTSSRQTTEKDMGHQQLLPFFPSPNFEFFSTKQYRLSVPVRVEIVHNVNTRAWNKQAPPLNKHTNKSCYVLYLWRQTLRVAQFFLFLLGPTQCPAVLFRLGQFGHFFFLLQPQLKIHVPVLLRYSRELGGDTREI